MIEKETLWRALADYRSGNGALSDYFIGRAHPEAGTAKTVKFDKSLEGSPHFTLLSSSLPEDTPVLPGMSK